jgi:molybdopterin/thiamine biosynthesis adenylyltransferase/rhodanese-related sulfurtransferase
MSRFERQHILAGFGMEAQQKLQNATVLVIGAGGLGCPIVLYLAAAGVGKIGIMDGDIVSLSNLNRQVLFGENDLGKPKASVAADYLRKKYSEIEITDIPEFITTANAIEIMSDYDLIIDGTDNFSTRYLVNDACILLKKPLVFGAIYEHEGQVMVFNSAKEGGTNYRDLYPNPPAASEIPNCNETGVLGVLPGIIGVMMATEAIKVLTGYAKSLENKILFFNSINYQTYTIDFNSNSELKNLIPDSFEAFQSKDYSLSCETVPSVDWDFALSQLNSDSIIVDIREASEMPKLSRAEVVYLPMSKLIQESKSLLASGEVFLFCQSGIRSLKAVTELQKVLPGKSIYSIKGGITAFLSKHQESNSHGS